MAYDPATRTVVLLSGAKDGRRVFVYRDMSREPAGCCVNAAPLVFPGRAYRTTMRALPLPRELSRRQAARSATRIRSAAKDTASAPDRRKGK